MSILAAWIGGELHRGIWSRVVLGLRVLDHWWKAMPAHQRFNPRFPIFDLQKETIRKEQS